MAMAVQGRPSRSAVRDTTGETAPRGYVFDELFTARYDESILDGKPTPAWQRPLPAWVRLAMEIERRRDDYDVIVSWSERVTLSLMALQHFAAVKRPHIAMLYWFSRPSVQLPLRALGNELHAIVTWSSVQRKFAIEHLGISPEKIYLVRHYVDQLFWSPRPPVGGQVDMICAAGAEMRDYPTLLAALRETTLRCHVASDHVRIDRMGLARRVSTEAFASMAGPNVTLGRRSLTDLRDLYARSRFVVVPLQASDTDNGVTVILEAMAMGKPVICSRTRGQVDVVQDGVTGLFVPVGDPAALRAAMLSLWNDPERAEAMGRAARDYAAKHHALEKFCGDVRAAIDASLDGGHAEADGSFAVPSANGTGR